jgi:hypothetical protein
MDSAWSGATPQSARSISEEGEWLPLAGSEQFHAGDLWVPVNDRIDEFGFLFREEFIFFNSWEKIDEASELLEDI